MAYNSDHIHNGTGTISDSRNIVAQIAVQIIDVLPNGNLVIQGKPGYVLRLHAKKKSDHRPAWNCSSG